MQEVIKSNKKNLTGYFLSDSIVLFFRKLNKNLYLQKFKIGKIKSVAYQKTKKTIKKNLFYITILHNFILNKLLDTKIQIK